jgi:hypothetical protein
MFHMETVYLQMAADQERVKDDLRRRHEYDHPESGSARVRSSHEGIVALTGLAPCARG